MTTTGFDDTDQVHHLADAALSVAREILDTEFWKILPDDLLMLGRQLEALSRTIHAAQLHLTGEIDTRGMAGLRSCSSTHALLRQALNISNADAIGRVKAARQILNRETLTSDELPPLLPVRAHAVDNGKLGAEHIRTIVETMDKIPAAAPAAAIAACEKALVETGVACDPNFLERAATRILERVDPDGDLDDRTADARMGLDFGGRNIRTGLTPLKGHLDDHGVEVVKKALDALAAPLPASDGSPDSRTPSNRRASALIAALRGYLDAGTGPSQGGEKPHLTVILSWDVITGMISNAGYDTGGHLTPAQARRLLCDAQVIPAVLGINGEVLDVGRNSRTFPQAVRRAIAARDRGCVWDGCDRPPDWCDAHHVKFWTRHFGSTSYPNGVLLCPYHHAEIHKEAWTIRMAPAGIPELIPPKWIDPAQKPRRNRLHHFAIETPA